MINIVLADDHSMIRSGLRKLLEQNEDFKVIKECANGLEVLEFLKINDKTDMVISDLNMPEMNGLEFAVKMVYKDRKHIGTELTDKLINIQFNSLHQYQAPSNLGQYTERELQVLELIAEGLTNNEISDKLFLSKRTIEGYRQSLLQKTAQKNTASLIRFAIKNRLIS